MTTRWIISGFRFVPFLMGRIWFNCNQVFSNFWFIFSNLRRVWDGYMYCYSHPTLFYFLNETNLRIEKNK